jgi:hypothetical protein
MLEKPENQVGGAEEVLPALSFCHVPKNAAKKSMAEK